ncbi:MAG: hypothetical protein ACRDJ1_09345 [Actinomycetota bacterium]
MSAPGSFDVLHALRLKGIVPLDAVAALLGSTSDDVSSIVKTLESDGLVRVRELPRLSGWTLTDAGRARHADEIASQRSAELVAQLTPLYERFLELNGRVKTVSTTWQQLAPDDAAGRWDAVEELGELHDEASAIVEAVAAIVPRFAPYPRRLAAAVEQLRAGDERFFTGVTVDSFHTVWFECHEDLIQTLGLDRIAEGSF